MFGCGSGNMVSNFGRLHSTLIEFSFDKFQIRSPNDGNHKRAGVARKKGRKENRNIRNDKPDTTLFQKLKMEHDGLIITNYDFHEVLCYDDL